MREKKKKKQRWRLVCEDESMMIWVLCFVRWRDQKKKKLRGFIGYGFQKEKRKRKKQKKKKNHFLCFFFLFETHNLSNPSIFSFANPSMHKTQSSNHHWLTFKYKSLSLFLFLFSLSYQCLSLRSMAISGGRFRWWVVIFVHLGLWVYGKFDFVFP